MQKLEAVVHTRGPIRSGEHLFREGDAFQALYAVKSGALKTYTIDSQGREHVLGFHIAGELVGLDGIHLRPQPLQRSGPADHFSMRLAVSRAWSS
jgi:CRP/FNR family transcriptional regulator, anaerobic regulatory protein